MLDSIAQRWSELEGRKGDLIARCEQYAMWTVPSICPMENEDGSEQSRGNVAIGARLVNHLSNRVVDTMFPSDRAFFALVLDPAVEDKLTEEMDEAELGQFREAVKQATARIEESGVRLLNLPAYRPIAILATSHNIVTGNAVILRLPSGERAVYGVKDFCILRDIAGKEQELILKDSKKFGNLPEELQNRLKAFKPEYKEDTDCVLYTRFKLERKRWHSTQAVDELDLPGGKWFKPVDCPFIALVWNLSRGESYGRGLVEDNSSLFSNIDTTTQAQLDLIGIAADLKFLVDPMSGLDIDTLNNAGRGSYVSGREGAISTPEFPKRLELNILSETINGWEQQLSQAFLLSTGAVRQAERVTAEEIRMYARELESAFGGLYSRLAINWQKLEAEYLISQLDFSTFNKRGIRTFDVVVTTGLESLSREGQLDALRLAIGDMQMLDAVPEELRAAINPRKFANFVCINRGVKIVDFLYTQEEMQANQQAAMQQQQQLATQQADANVREAAGKSAVES